MNRATYKLAGQVCAERGLVDVYGPADDKGNKPLIHKGLEITTPEATSHEELLSLMEDGKESHADKLAQGQLDIIRQRKIREAAEDALTAAILNGERVEMDAGSYKGETVNFADQSEDDRKEAVRDRLQAIGDEYVYGARGAATGGAAKVVKEKAARADKLTAAAASGELSEAEIEKLKALGIL